MKAFVICFLVFICMTPHTQARPVTFSSNALYSYRLENKLLTDFLHSFMAEQGYQVIISEKIQNQARRLNGIQQGTPEKIFNSILKTNQLMSFFDGNQVYIYQLSETQQRFVAVEARDTRILQQTIRGMNLNDDQNQTRFNRRTGLVSISGTPAYVRQIEGVIRALNIKNLNAASEFKYFTLKFAWATDRVFTVGGREVTIPGVATILRKAIGEQPTAVPDDWDDPLPAKAESLKGKGMSSIGQQARKEASPNPLYDQYLAHKGKTPASRSKNAIDKPAFVDNGISRVVADPHHNGLIIRDLPERMPLYAKLIETLDKPTPIVEIEATIIDINIDKLSEQGIQWRAGQNNLEVLFGRSRSKANLLGGAIKDSVQVLDQVPGFQIGAVVGDHTKLVAQLNLLEKDGLIKITSRPRVATLNDLDAVIESGHSLYVPVEGAFETDLFKVYSGTVLRVNPHIIQQGPSKQIRLIVSVEDGNVDVMTDEKGNSIPRSTRNSVVTQAIVRNGHSLLLGGLVREKHIEETDRVPVLGELPVVGKLFSNNRDNNTRSERMYIISPRLITPRDADQAAEVALNQQGSSPPALKEESHSQRKAALKKSGLPECVEDCPAPPQPARATDFILF